MKPGDIVIVRETDKEGDVKVHVDYIGRSGDYFQGRRDGDEKSLWYRTKDIRPPKDS